MNAFDDLSDDAKAELIWRNAYFVASIEFSNVKANLFTIGAMFIEIQFDRQTSMHKSVAILTEKELEKYVQEIELPTWD